MKDRHGTEGEGWRGWIVIIVLSKSARQPSRGWQVEESAFEQFTKGTGATWTRPSWAESVFPLQSQSTRPLSASKQVWVQALNTSPSSRREQYRKTEERLILRRAMKTKLLRSQRRRRGPGTKERAAHSANYTKNQWCYVILCANKRWQDFVTFQGSDSLILGFKWAAVV